MTLPNLTPTIPTPDPSTPPSNSTPTITPPAPPGSLLKTYAPNPQKKRKVDELIDDFRDLYASGRVSDDDLARLVGSLPRAYMRKLVYQYSGMEASMVATLNKQVEFIDRILSKMITASGDILPSAVEMGVSVKDALRVSTDIARLITRDLPRVYSVDRYMKLERSIGDVMEEYLTPEQQAKVLDRLQQLTSDAD